MPTLPMGMPLPPLVLALSERRALAPSARRIAHDNKQCDAELTVVPRMNGIVKKRHAFSQPTSSYTKQASRIGGSPSG